MSMTNEHIEKYKKVSFFKNHPKNEQQILFNANDPSKEKQQNDHYRNKTQFSFTQESPSLKNAKSSYYFRDKDMEKLNQTETKTTNDSSISSSANIHLHHDSQSFSLEKFKKINKLLFFKSRDKKSHENEHEENEISNNDQKPQKKICCKNDKKSPFIINQDLNSQNNSKKNPNSYFNSLKKWPIIIDKNDFKYKQDQQQKLNKSQQNPQQIQQQEQQCKYFYNDSFSLKNKLNREVQQLNSTEGMSYEQWISNYNANQEKKRQENAEIQKNDQIPQDQFKNQMVKSTSLSKIINKIHTQKSELNLKSQNNSQQQERFDSTTTNSIESPLKKTHEQQNLFKSISTIKKKNDEILIKDIVKDKTPYIIESPDLQKQMKQISIGSNKRFSQAKSSLSFHLLKTEESQNSQLSSREYNHSPKKVPQINNLLQYSKNVNSNNQTPQAQIHHFNQNIKKQIRLSKNSNNLCLYRNGALTSSHVLIKAGEQSNSARRIQFKERLKLHSKTPVERNRIPSKQSSLCQIQQSPDKLTSPAKQSNFFSSYVALTFKNSLMELRKRQKLQFIQKLNFHSKQALGRLVIYINDMLSEYQNIKKVSQIIYQLIYHIPYLVNMLFQNEKILLREKIDIYYINNFLSNKQNMENCFDNRNETYEQMIEKKISQDIIFLNEKLTEFIKRRFQDRFELISQNIIDEHSNVKNLEKQIEEKIAKIQRIEKNPNNKLLYSKHNYAGVDNYMFHAKSNNGITFASTHYNEIKRLGEFNSIDQQNVAISYELDNLYSKVQNETSHGANDFEFPIQKYSFYEDDD